MPGLGVALIARVAMAHAPGFNLLLMHIAAIAWTSKGPKRGGGVFGDPFSGTGLGERPDLTTV